MKHVWKLGSIVLTAFVLWISLLLNEQSSPLPRQTVLVLPLYAVVALGCYGLAMVGYGLIVFRNCPEEAALLKKDIAEAVTFLQSNGIDIKE